MSIITNKVSPIQQREFADEPKGRIQLQIHSEACAPELVVNNLASIEGPLDIYCWYEGPQYLPQLGANFMKNSLLEPLYKLKQDAKVYLYSLKAWDKKNILEMAPSTSLGEAINRINKKVIECIYSSSFFQYCSMVPIESGIYTFLNEELPKKKWLFTLSETHRKTGVTIAELFNNKHSTFDSIKKLDLSESYSLMQYVEGYYLIQEAIEKGLSSGQKKIQIAFLLPNDEGKYYLDYPQDIEKMLKLDFGDRLSNVLIDLSFHFFEYGGDKVARPYIDKRRNAPKVQAGEIAAYFDYLYKPHVSNEESPAPFLRDVIHKLGEL